MSESTSAQQLLLGRLADQGRDRESWALDVLAACDGPAALASFLDDGVQPSVSARRRGGSAIRQTSRDVPRAYLKSILVRSFRGIGPAATLDLAHLIAGTRCRIWLRQLSSWTLAVRHDSLAFRPPPVSGIELHLSALSTPYACDLG
jgi:hypothetical protein